MISRKLRKIKLPYYKRETNFREESYQDNFGIADRNGDFV